MGKAVRNASLGKYLRQFDLNDMVGGETPKREKARVSEFARGVLGEHRSDKYHTYTM